MVSEADPSQIVISCTPSSLASGQSFTCTENSAPQIPVTWTFNGTNAAKDCADETTLLASKTCTVDNNY